MIRNDQADHIERAKTAVAAAKRHHAAAVKAFEDGADDNYVRTCHTRLGRSLEDAAAALSAAAPPTPSSNQVQTSQGVTDSGGATAGRGSPLLRGDFKSWLDRARIGAGR